MDNHTLADDRLDLDFDIRERRECREACELARWKRSFHSCYCDIVQSCLSYQISGPPLEP